MDTVPHHADSGNIPLKRCPTCPEGQQWHPATPEFWRRRKHGKYGLDAQCKECQRHKIPGRTKPEPIPIPEGYKRCFSCPEGRQLHPATPEFWNRNKSRTDGLGTQCKKCCSQRKTPQPDPVPEGYKRCPTCPKEHQIHPATTEFFHHDKQRIDGLHGLCKKCVKAHQNRPEIRDHMLAQKKARRNLPEIKERERLQHIEYMSHPENRERARANDKKWGATKARNRRARQKAIAGTHTLEQVREQLKRQKGCCYYAACGFAKFKRKVDGTYDYHVEHTFPVSRVAGSDIPANDMSYLVLACPDCNNKKLNKFPHEWPEGGRLL